MSAARELLQQGMANMLQQMGEPVTFGDHSGAQPVMVIVAAREPEMDLVEGGWRKGSTFAIEVPVGAVTPPPKPRDLVTLRGTTATIRTVATPHPHRPSFSCIAET